VLALQVASDKAVRTAAGRGSLNEDLFPILEYEAPRAFFLGHNSELLLSYDERLLPREKSLLYFSRYLQKHPLSVAEIKEIATYYLTYGSLTGQDLPRIFVDLWLRQAPRDPEARGALARIEEQKGNIDAALKEIRYLLSLRPDNREYLDAAARLESRAYLTRRSVINSVTPKKALAYLNRLLDLETKKDAIYRRIAHIHAAEKDYPSAIVSLEKAASYAEKNKGELQPGALWLEAAEMALEMGDFQAALSDIQKALAHNPKNSSAKRKWEIVSRLSEAKP
jgi:tetratricopeptide (TPR) repeat protein